MYSLSLRDVISIILDSYILLFCKFFDKLIFLFNKLSL